MKNLTYNELIEDKKAEIKMLQEDIAIFGPAGDDLARIAKLKQDIINLTNDKQ